MYLIGFDIGSSSIKAALVDAGTKEILSISKYPSLEMDILSRSEGWAEQHPELWWENLCNATRDLLDKTGVDPKKISSIGISYQMHGLVLVDENQNVLRPSIIWCDSRAVQIGNTAFEDLGKDYCLENYLNSPGNFTASKLKWVQDHEPELFDRIHAVMLPGDYIAMKLSGVVNTTVTGLSEGIFWNFKEHMLASKLLEYYGFDPDILAPVVDNFTTQSEVNKSASEQLGLPEGIPITYRAGDQANNAMSLSVFNPGEVAATGGTSGVVYAVVDKYIHDDDSRINGFAHVNHRFDDPRVGLLLCINGAGIQYSWVKKQLANEGVDYRDIERMISSIPVGADGLRILPFGNGAERMLRNLSAGAQVNNLQFNRHTKAHFYRAALEGVAFSFVYGFGILKELGVDPSIIKVGNDNLFQSQIFSSTIANLLGISIEVHDTTGAAGAAIASGIGIGQYTDLKDAFSENNVVDTVNPANLNGMFQNAFQLWKSDLEQLINTKAI